jgi:hypothetical protein
MTTTVAPHASPDESSELLAHLPELPRDGDAPVFNAPWEAAAFAMTLALYRRDTYYRHWLTALERIAAAKGCVTNEGLLERRDAWDRAARRTPHGQPIEL